MDALQYGNRLDGTPKSTGWYGELKVPGMKNTVATELSMSFDYGDGDVLVPLINPRVTQREILEVLSGQEPSKEMENKTYFFGLERIQQGKSPFIEVDEKPLVWKETK